jgi:hypothetical protein
VTLQEEDEAIRMAAAGLVSHIRYIKRINNMRFLGGEGGGGEAKVDETENLTVHRR